MQAFAMIGGVFALGGAVGRRLGGKKKKLRNSGPDAEELGLVCAVCLDELCLPKVLPCGHSVCLGCSLDLVRQRDVLERCPVCRHHVGRRLEKLPLNYSLISCLERILPWNDSSEIDTYRDRERVAKERYEKYCKSKRSRKPNPLRWIQITLLVAAELGGILFSVKDVMQARKVQGIYGDGRKSRLTLTDESSWGDMDVTV